MNKERRKGREGVGEWEKGERERENGGREEERERGKGGRTEEGRRKGRRGKRGSPNQSVDFFLSVGGSSRSGSYHSGSLVL